MRVCHEDSTTANCEAGPDCMLLDRRYCLTEKCAKLTCSLRAECPVDVEIKLGQYSRISIMSDSRFCGLTYGSSSAFNVINSATSASSSGRAERHSHRRMVVAAFCRCRPMRERIRSYTPPRSLGILSKVS